MRFLSFSRPIVFLEFFLHVIGVLAYGTNCVLLNLKPLLRGPTCMQTHKNYGMSNFCVVCVVQNTLNVHKNARSQSHVSVPVVKSLYMIHFHFFGSIEIGGWLYCCRTCPLQLHDVFVVALCWLGLSSGRMGSFFTRWQQWRNCLIEGCLMKKL